MKRLAALSLLLVTACGASAPATPPAPPAPPPGPYARVSGRWVGEGKQYDGQKIAITMTLRADGAVGEPIGTIEYFDFGCGGELVRLPEEGGLLVVREHLTHGEDKCLEGGTIKFPNAPTEEKLEWRYYMPGTTQEGARAFLIPGQ